MAALELDMTAQKELSAPIIMNGGSSIGSRILRSRSHIERKAADVKSGKTKTAVKQLTEKEITKLYTNQKLSRVKITPLETIFEQSEECEANDSGNCSSNSSDSGLNLPIKSDPAQIIFGKRKVKRAVLFSESMKPTKTLREKRKKRVLALLGNRKRFKHMSMRSFLERFEANDTISFDMVKTTDVFTSIKVPTWISLRFFKQTKIYIYSTYSTERVSQKTT